MKHNYNQLKPERISITVENGLITVNKIYYGVEIPLFNACTYQEANNLAFDTFGQNDWIEYVKMLDDEKDELDLSATSIVASLYADLWRRGYIKLETTTDKNTNEKVVNESDLQNESNSKYEYVNEPEHYGGTECIDNMRKLYGDDAVRWFCVCNAYKYEYRAGKKPGADRDTDLEKAKWYKDYVINNM